MTPQTIHVVAFFATVLVFAFVGFFSARRQHTAKDYFRNESAWKNAVSLTASNITLGTGLVYLVSGAQQLGTLLLIAPWALFAGYVILGRLAESTARNGPGPGKNLLDDVTQRIASATGQPCAFARVVSAVLALLLVMLLAFEIFASTKVMTPLLFGRSEVHSEVLLSTVLFAITLLYTILGGIRAVFAVDFLQVPLIVLFLPAFVWIGTTSGDGASLATTVASRATLSPVVVLGVAAASINAFAGQFFSLLNIGTVSQVEAQEKRRVLKRVGLMTAVALSLFILVGLFVSPSGDQAGWTVLMNRFDDVARSGAGGLVVSSLIVLGMTSIVLTTTDAVIFNAILFWYDNVLGRNSTSATADRTEIVRIRSIGAVAFSISFGLLSALNYFQPDPFYFLLALGGGASVLSPAIALAIILSRSKGTAAAFTPNVFRVFLTLLAVASISNAALVVQRSPWVSTLTTTMFLLSAAFAFAVWFRAHRREVRS